MSHLIYFQRAKYGKSENEKNVDLFRYKVNWIGLNYETLHINKRLKVGCRIQ